MTPRNWFVSCLALCSAFVLLVGCSDSSRSRSASPTAAASVKAQARSATARLEPTQNSKVKGEVTFTEVAGGVRVVAHVEGLAPGQHGFHVHDKGDCSAPDASSAGGHFNPTGVKHGAPSATEHHAGDFGNIDATASGMAHAEFTTQSITLDDGPTSAIGRAVIVHEKADDMTTQPTGNAGGRLACGVVVKK